MIYSSVSEFDLKICEQLSKVAVTLGIETSLSKAKFVSDLLLKELVSTHPNEFVLLIDEYDYPLTHSLDNEAEFNAYRRYLQGLFGAIKELTGSMRFIFITGVGRFAKTSVFSQLNNLRDLGLEEDFATLLGYTEEDVHQCFDEYVDNAARIIGLSKEQTYEQLKAYYDGYRFHVDNATTVYSPWSVLNFLATPKNGFRNYWYETGGSYPTLISSYIKSIQDTPLETLQKVRVSEDDLNLYYELQLLH